MVHEPPPSAKQARLIILATGQSIPLTGQQMVVGRQTSPPLADVDIRLAERTLSRYQAILRKRQGTFTVEDHPSSVSGVWQGFLPGTAISVLNTSNTWKDAYMHFTKPTHDIVDTYV